MTGEEAINMLKAKRTCIERETSGVDKMCSSGRCMDCPLNYEQGNLGEQKETLDVAIKALEQEPCENCVSREFMYKLGAKCIAVRNENDVLVAIASIESLPSAIPKQKTGHWFYDKSIENWRCSECKETPKTMGYCGSANFMAEHFKFCNHCGARMVETQTESEE